MSSPKRMSTFGVQLDTPVLDLLRQEAEVRMKPISELARVGICKWMVQQRILRADQLNDEGRFIPEGLRQKKRRRLRKEAADAGNVTALHDDADDAAE